MIKLYAVDPAFSSSHPNPELFIATFGVAAGRLLASYPNEKSHRWLEMLYKSAGPSTIKRKQIEAIIKRLKHGDRSTGFVGVPGLKYDPLDSWLNNAVDQSWDFNTIVSDGDSDSDKVISVDEARDWVPQPSIPVQRSAASLSQELFPLLRCAREIRFVDPHFRVFDEGTSGERAFRFLNVIVTLLQDLSRSMPKRPIVSIHMLHKRDASLSEFESECSKYLAPPLPEGWSIELCRWRHRDGGDKLHDRYVLTDLGGIGIQGGLDEGRAEHNHSTSLNLMGRDDWMRRWYAYSVIDGRAQDTSYTLVDALKVTAGMSRASLA